MHTASGKPSFHFGLYGAGLGAMATPASAKIAQLAEALGFESLWTGEHMVIPDPQEPPSHRSPRHPFLDPIVSMAFLAASTSTIRLATGVLLIPQRHPVQLAKELASLDVLSGGRVIAGVGVGYVDKEMRALGVDPRTRGARADEHIEAMLRLWRDESPEYSGRFVNFHGVDAHPRPVQPGGPPLIVGGGSTAALKRAVRFGNGWFGHRQTLHAASAVMHELRALAVAAGRDVEELSITVSLPSGGRGMTGEQLRAYADAGVDRVIFKAEGGDLDAVRRLIEENQPARWADALHGYDVTFGGG